MIYILIIIVFRSFKSRSKVLKLPKVVITGCGISEPKEIFLR